MKQLTVRMNSVLHGNEFMCMKEKIRKNVKRRSLKLLTRLLGALLAANSTAHPLQTALLELELELERELGLLFQSGCFT